MKNVVDNDSPERFLRIVVFCAKSDHPWSNVKKMVARKLNVPMFAPQF